MGKRKREGREWRRGKEKTGEGRGSPPPHSKFLDPPLFTAYSSDLQCG